MKSLRFTCFAIAAVVSASALSSVTAQSTRVGNTDSGATITSLTQIRRPHGAPTALDSIQASADVSVSPDVLLAPPVTDSAMANDLQSRGGSAHARPTGSLSSPAASAGSLPSSPSNITGLNQMTTASGSFGASSSTAPRPAISIASSPQSQHADPLRNPAPAATNG